MVQLFHLPLVTQYTTRDGASTTATSLSTLATPTTFVTGLPPPTTTTAGLHSTFVSASSSSSIDPSTAAVITDNSSRSNKSSSLSLLRTTLMTVMDSASTALRPGAVVNTVDTNTSNNSTGSTTVVDTIAAAAAAAAAPTPSGKTYPEEFYHAMKNDIVGNTILYLDIPLPKKMKMQCDPSIRLHLKRVSPKISDLLISNGIVRHPTSKFSMDLKPMNENTYPVLYSINKPHQIPRWCNKNNTDVDGSTIGDNDDDSDVPDRDEKPEKIGMSIAGFATRRKLDKYQADPNRFDRAYIVMNTGLIRGKVDQEIVGILEEFVAAVLADKNVPKQLRLLFETYRRGGNDLGLRKQWYYQLIEISLQYYFDVASPAEAFACDCMELESRLSFVQQVDAMLQVYFCKYQGKQVTVIESWKTGAKAARLSSQWTLAEYFACGARLRDAAPYPVYPDATTREEIFSDDYPETDMKQFRNEVKTDIEANQRTKGVLFLCYWEKLFSYSELDNYLSSLGYKLTCNVFQDDLIFYVDSNQESMVAVYHSPGIGLDSRDTITIIQSIRRLQLIEIIRRFVLFLQGKNLVDDQKKKGRSLIDTGFIYDSVWNCSHQNKFVAAAIGRDTYTPSSINATTQNDLRKASHELVAPNVRLQYYRNNDPLDERMCNQNLLGIKMANLLSFTNHKNINATLNTICYELTNDNPTQDVLRNRWDKLEQVIRPNSVLLQLVQEYEHGRQLLLPPTKGPWTEHEDAIVMAAVTNSSEQPFTRWSDLAQQLPGRARQRIRDHWVNQLDPNINRLPFSREEDLRLWDGYKKFGKKWVEISMKLFQSTRPENQIKNRWYSASFKKFISIAVTTDNIKNNGEPPGRGFTIANPTLSTSALAEDPAIRPGHGVGGDGGVTVASTSGRSNTSSCVGTLSAVAARHNSLPPSLPNESFEDWMLRRACIATDIIPRIDSLVRARTNISSSSSSPSKTGSSLTAPLELYKGASVGKFSSTSRSTASVPLLITSTRRMGFVRPFTKSSQDTTTNAATASPLLSPITSTSTSTRTTSKSVCLSTAAPTTTPPASSSSAAVIPSEQPSNRIQENVQGARWTERYEQLVDYQKEHKSTCGLRSYNPQLAKWVSKQRTNYNANSSRLTTDRIDRLNKIGFVWKL